MRACEYMRVRPDQVETLERRGWRVAGGSTYANMQLQVLMVRPIVAGAPVPMVPPVGRGGGVT